MKDINKQDKKNPFSVPGDYFESFTDDLLNSVRESKPFTGRRFFTIIRPHLALAAAMIALVIVTYSGLRLLLPGMHSQDIDQESIAEYISREVDQEVIIDMIMTLDDGHKPGGLTENEIVDYLVETGIDLSTMIENY